MTTRFFRTSITNQVQNSTLQQRDMRLCGGDWTPGWSPPPASIRPGETAAWQSESGGIWQGTQGWVKYDLVSDSGAFALIYLYWTNPFWGVTHPDGGIYGSEKTADCGDDEPKGSTFTAKFDKPTNLTLQPQVFRGAEGGPLDRDNPIEEWLLAPHAPWALALLAFGGIWLRMNVEWSLAEVGYAPVTPLPAKSKVSRVVVSTNPESSDFVGSWVGDRVAVHIAMTGPDTFDVRVDDTFRDPDLHLHEKARLGPGAVFEIVSATLRDNSMLKAMDLKANSPTARALGEAADHGRSIVDSLSRPSGASRLGVELKARNSQQRVGRHITPASVHPALARMKEIAPWTAVVDQAAKQSHHILLLAGGQVALMLQSVLDPEGAVIDQTMLYQRLGPLGLVVHQQDLSFDLGVK